MVVRTSLLNGYSSPVFQGRLKFLVVGKFKGEFGFIVEDSDA